MADKLYPQLLLFVVIRLYRKVLCLTRHTSKDSAKFLVFLMSDLTCSLPPSHRYPVATLYGKTTRLMSWLYTAENRGMGEQW